MQQNKTTHNFQPMSLEAALDCFKSDDLYFVMFSTTWCPDCKMMHLMLNNLVPKYQALGLNFVEIDAEAAKLFQHEDGIWKVLKVPAFYLVKGTKREFIGYEFIPIPIIEQKIKQFIEANK